jgi:hypothetical protein
MYLDSLEIGARSLAMPLFLLAFALYQPQSFECLNVSLHIFGITPSKLGQLTDRDRWTSNDRGVGSDNAPQTA